MRDGTDLVFHFRVPIVKTHGVRIHHWLRPYVSTAHRKTSGPGCLWVSVPPDSGNLFLEHRSLSDLRRGGGDTDHGPGVDLRDVNPGGSGRGLLLRSPDPSLVWSDYVLGESGRVGSTGTRLPDPSCSERERREGKNDDDGGLQSGTDESSPYLKVPRTRITSSPPSPCVVRRWSMVREPPRTCDGGTESYR